MTVATTYAVRLDSLVQELNPPFIPRAVRITNYSADNLAFDNSVDPVLLIPPGVVVPINIDHLVSTLRIRSASNTTGRATIQVLDSQLDVSNAPNLQQLPGTITAAIPSAVTVTGPGGGNVPSSDATLQALVTTLNSLITTLNGIATSTKGNTGILTGLLPSSTSQFTLTSGQDQASTITNAVPGFGLQATIPGAGRLNSYLVASGQTIYLVRDAMFLNGPNVGTPIVKRFREPIPAGAILHTRWDDSTFSASFVLKV